MYSASGGKAVRHGWVGSATNIAILSYLLVQTFEHRWASSFNGHHGNCLALSTLSFAHISSDMVLTTIPPSSCILGEGYRTVEVDAPSMMVFNELHRCLPAIREARNELARRRRKDK
jgi:hypothetical protein